MAQEKITIKFIPDGNVALVRAIKELNRATRQLNGQLNKLNQSNVAVAKSQTLVQQRVGATTRAANASSTAFTRLQATISVYRNKVLLAGFATTLLLRPLINTVAAFGRFQDLEKGFVNLGATIGATSEHLNKLDRATNGTVDAMDLMQQANNAMMLGIVTSEDEMANLFDTAQRLGQALGRDTVSSIESLVTGMGRQSRLMLDNLGIIVKTEEAYQNFADANGRLVTSLTDSEKKQAFNEEAMRKANEIVETLGKEVLSTSQVIATMSVSTGKLSRSLGEVLRPVIVAVAKSLQIFADNINVKLIKAFSAGIAVAAATFGIYTAAVALNSNRLLVNFGLLVLQKGAFQALTISIKASAAATLAFSKALAKNKMALFIGLTVAATAALYNFMTAEDEQAIKDREKKQREEEASKRATERIIKLKEELDLLNATTEAERRKILAGEDLTEAELVLIDAITIKKQRLQEIKDLDSDIASLRTKTTQDIIAETEALIANTEAQILNNNAIVIGLLEASGGFESFENNLGHATGVNSEFNKELEKQNEEFEFLQEKLDKLKIKLGLLNDSLEDGIAPFVLFRENLADVLENTRDFFAENAELAQNSAQSQIDSIESKTQAEIEALRKSRRFSKMSSEQQAAEEKRIRDKAEKDKAKQKKQANRLVVAQFNFDKALRVEEALMSTKRGVAAALELKPPMSFIMAAATLAMGMEQVRAIAQSKPPKMAQGGLVGGRRHSQGGTLIEAEQGEFVMNRNAVDAIGVETLNRMNRGGGAPVSISFSGNVMSDDFIENEAIPKIKEAVRRGSDIGVS